MLIKIHRATRYVVAICDSELFGKKFIDQDNVRQLDLTTNFFNGKETSEEETEDLIKDMMREDASFNIVGENSCRIALKAGAIEEDGITKIADIPVALTLL